MTTALPVPIDTQWMELSGTIAPESSEAQTLIIVVIILAALAPMTWWKLFRSDRWPRKKSLLFLSGCLATLVPVALVLGWVSDDTPSTVYADVAVAQALPSGFPLAPDPETITVAASEHADGLRLDVPDSGEQLDYRVTFGSEHRGNPVRCRATLSLSRDEFHRGRRTASHVRLLGHCS
ncbi:hypothetical protein [Gordonia phthalatica]|uniref:Uncharacterized protein n=1 Tax=Gordonia phthalatica TaxID=1136941 RepID=A0A0N9MQB5_9ACTN|nr:hypothetical protein [Gordonia phthalatica]ALG84510.1 hypothetical protein ACH46_08370 [Gordonia phthalatica]